MQILGCYKIEQAPNCKYEMKVQIFYTWKVVFWIEGLADTCVYKKVAAAKLTLANMMHGPLAKNRCHITCG